MEDVLLLRLDGESGEESGRGFDVEKLIDGFFNFRNYSCFVCTLICIGIMVAFFIRSKQFKEIGKLPKIMILIVNAMLILLSIGLIFYYHV